MKKIFTMVFSACLLLMSFTFLSDVNDVISALKQADSNEFVKYLDDYVDVKLPQKSEIKNISKTQASITIKDFFSQQNINGFDLASQREIGGTGYLAGKLKSDNSTYNVTIMLKANGSDVVITSIRIN